MKKDYVAGAQMDADRVSTLGKHMTAACRVKTFTCLEIKAQISQHVAQVNVYKPRASGFTTSYLIDIIILRRSLRLRSPVTVQCVQTVTPRVSN